MDTYHSNNKSEIVSPAKSLIKNMSFIVAFFILIEVVMGYSMSKSIATHLEEMLDSMIAISKGNLKSTMSINSNDEFGVLSYKFNEMKEKIKELIDNVHNSLCTLNTSTDELSITSRVTTHAIHETTATTQEVAKAIESQAVDTQQVLKKINHLSKQVEDIHEQSLIMRYNTDHILKMFNNDKEIIESLIKITEQSVIKIEKVSEITKK